MMCRGPKGCKNIRILHSDSKAQDEGDSRTHGYAYVYVAFRAFECGHSLCLDMGKGSGRLETGLLAWGWVSCS